MISKKTKFPHPRRVFQEVYYIFFPQLSSISLINKTDIFLLIRRPSINTLLKSHDN